MAKLVQALVIAFSMVISGIAGVFIDRQWTRYGDIALSPGECGFFAEDRLTVIAKLQEAGRSALVTNELAAADLLFGKAAQLLEKQITECNSPDAKLQMSFAYCYGLGVEKNEELAKRYFASVPLDMRQAERLYRKGVYECKS